MAGAKIEIEKCSPGVEAKFAGIRSFFYFVWEAKREKRKLVQVVSPQSRRGLERRGGNEDMKSRCEAFAEVLFPNEPPGPIVERIWVHIARKANAAFLVYVVPENQNIEDLLPEVRDRREIRGGERRRRVVELAAAIEETIKQFPSPRTLAEQGQGYVLRSNTLMKCSSALQTFNERITRREGIPNGIATILEEPARGIYRERTESFARDIGEMLSYLRDRMRIKSPQAMFAIITASLSERPRHERLITLETAAKRWVTERDRLPSPLAPEMPESAVKFLWDVYARLKFPLGGQAEEEAACVYTKGAINFMVALMVSGTCNCECFTHYALAAAEEKGLENLVLPAGKAQSAFVAIVDTANEEEEEEDKKCEDEKKEPGFFRDRRALAAFAGTTQTVRDELLDGISLERKVHPVVAAVDASSKDTEQVAEVLVVPEFDEENLELINPKTKLLVRPGVLDVSRGLRRSIWTNLVPNLLALSQRRQLSVQRLHFELVLIALLAGLPPDTFGPVVAIAMTRSSRCIRVAFALQHEIFRFLVELDKVDAPTCRELKRTYHLLWRLAAFRRPGQEPEHFSWARARPPLPEPRKCYFNPDRICRSSDHSKLGYSKSELVELARQCGLPPGAENMTKDGLCTLLSDAFFRQRRRTWFVDFFASENENAEMPGTGVSRASIRAKHARDPCTVLDLLHFDLLLPVPLRMTALFFPHREFPFDLSTRTAAKILANPDALAGYQEGVDWITERMGTEELLDEAACFPESELGQTMKCTMLLRLLVSTRILSPDHYRALEREFVDAKAEEKGSRRCRDDPVLAKVWSVYLKDAKRERLRVTEEVKRQTSPVAPDLMSQDDEDENAPGLLDQKVIDDVWDVPDWEWDVQKPSQRVLGSIESKRRRRRRGRKADGDDEDESDEGDEDDEGNGEEEEEEEEEEYDEGDQGNQGDQAGQGQDYDEDEDEGEDYDEGDEGDGRRGYQEVVEGRETSQGALAGQARPEEDLDEDDEGDEGDEGEEEDEEEKRQRLERERDERDREDQDFWEAWQTQRDQERLEQEQRDWEEQTQQDLLQEEKHAQSLDVAGQGARGP